MERASAKLVPRMADQWSRRSSLQRITPFAELPFQSHAHPIKLPSSGNPDVTDATD
jgi:hypothetical protein